MASRKRTWLIILTVILVLGVAAAAFLTPLYEGSSPEITLQPTPAHLGLKNIINLQVDDRGRGLASVRAAIIQGGREKVILNRTFGPSSPWQDGGTFRFKKKLVIEPLKLGLTQGKAVLVIQARDRSLSRWMHGNVAVLETHAAVDTTPPRVSVLSRLAYVNRGGAALAVYRVSPDAVRHGVRVGDHWFRGYTPWPKRPGAALCYFAYSQSLPKNAPIRIWAADAAGNQTQVDPQVRLRWRRFRHEKLKLSDRTINILGSRFAVLAPADVQGPLAVFVWVNTKLRGMNHQTIISATKDSADKQYWRGAFVRPPGKTTAGFGDRRTYFYKNKQISKAVHLGVDLADVSRSPIKAAAAGRVLFAGPLGIYGNCVILDHGLGAATLYGHLSSLETTKGQEVSAGQVLGRSGATGLALGDHLHFSVLVDGIYVDPREWWDPHWIRDNIRLHLQEAGLPTP